MSGHSDPEQADDAPLPPARVLRLSIASADLLIGAALLAMAAWFGVIAYRMNDYSGPNIGPADFPGALAVLLGVGAVALLGGAVLRLAQRRATHAISIRRPQLVLLGMALFVAFPALMTLLGYYPAMALWLAAFLWLSGSRSILAIAAFVAGFLVFTKLVFEMILGTPLP